MDIYICIYINKRIIIRDHILSPNPISFQLVSLWSLECSAEIRLVGLVVYILHAVHL